MVKTSSADEQLKVAAESNNLSAFLVSLGFNLGLGVVLFLLFCILRPLKPKIFSPRTQTLLEHERLAKLPSSFFGWIKPLILINHQDVLLKCGVDSYTVVRFLFVFTRLFACLALVVPTLLLPVYMVGQKGLPGLDSTSISNIKDQARIWAQAVGMLLVSVCTLGTIVYELKLLAKTRETHLLGLGAQVRTILLTNLTSDLSTPTVLSNLYESFPGGIEKINLCQDNSKLIKLELKRQELVQDLETLLVNSVLKHSTKPDSSLKRKISLNGISPMFFTSRMSRADETIYDFPNKSELPLLSSLVKDNETELDEDLIELKRVKKLCQGINELTTEIKRNLDFKESSNKSAGFITFNSILAARLAEQAETHTSPISIISNVHPLDVVERNLFLSIWQRTIRSILFKIFIGVIIVFWAIPVTFVSSFASLSSISKLIPFLSFVETLPKIVVGFIEGVLPSVSISLLVLLLLKLLLSTTFFEGALRFTDIQLSIMDKHFGFLLFNVLFVVTLASGALQAIGPILDKPATIFPMLGQSMPKVANFFISFMLFQSLVGLTMDLLSPVSFIAKSVFGNSISGLTPRGFLKNSSTTLPVWGWIWPTYTLMITITLTYATLAPIILFFSVIYFCLAYFVMMYKVCCVFDWKPESETGGLYYIKALYQSLYGVCVFQVITFSIVLLNGQIGPTIIAGLSLAATALVHKYCNTALLPSLRGLPVTSTTRNSEFLEKSIQSHHSISRSYSRFVSSLPLKSPRPDRSSRTFSPKDELNYKRMCSPNPPPVWLPDIFPVESSHIAQLITFINSQDITVVIGNGARLDLKAKEFIMELPAS